MTNYLSVMKIQNASRIRSPILLSSKIIADHLSKLLRRRGHAIGATFDNIFVTRNRVFTTGGGYCDDARLSVCLYVCGNDNSRKKQLIDFKSCTML